MDVRIRRLDVKLFSKVSYGLNRFRSEDLMREFGLFLSSFMIVFQGWLMIAISIRIQYLLWAAKKGYQIQICFAGDWWLVMSLTFLDESRNLHGFFVVSSTSPFHSSIFGPKLLIFRQILFCNIIQPLQLSYRFIVIYHLATSFTFARLFSKTIFYP